MKLKLTKTWELVLRGKTKKPPPEITPIINRNSKLKFLGVNLPENSSNWDTNFHTMMSKDILRLYILIICKYYRYTLGEPMILFHSLIMSVFTYAIKV